MERKCFNCIYYDIVTTSCEATNRLMAQTNYCEGYTPICDLEDVIQLDELYNIEDEDHNLNP